MHKEKICNVYYASNIPKLLLRFMIGTWHPQKFCLEPNVKSWSSRDGQKKLKDKIQS